MRQRPGIGDVVNRDDIDILVAQRRAKNIAPNPTEPVDPNLNRHALLASSFLSSDSHTSTAAVNPKQLNTVDPWKNWQDNARLAALSSAQFTKLFETACGRMT